MLEQIKSKKILKIIFQNVQEGIYLRLLNHNKKLQKKLDIIFDSFIKYSNQIIIEIIPKKVISYETRFINICGNKTSYHILFDGRKEEIKRDFISKGENISKIKIIIDEDKEMNSFNGLFKYCDCMEEINFIKFNRRNIIDMSNMFKDCRSLKKLNISKLKTDNVTSMKYMFKGCSSLSILDL